MPVTLEFAQDRHIRASIVGEIDHHIAKGLRAEIDSAVLAGQPPLLILDFGGVTFMDSSGIGLIMGRYKLMEEQGGKLLVTHVPRALKKVMQISGLDKLGILDTTEV